MAEPGISGEEQPVVQPRVIRLLRKRPKLVAENMRNDILEQVEQNITERRRPDTAAERVVQRVLDEARHAGEQVFSGRVRDRMVEANEGALRRL